MSLRLVAASAPDAAEAGLNLLDRRAVTEAQMREYLADKGFDAVAVEDAVVLFAARGWLDDRDYATELVRQRSAKPGLSRARLRADMKKRGLQGEEIDAALEALDAKNPDWEAQNAMTFLEGKLATAKRGVSLSNSTERKKLQAKLWRYLATRGFESGLSTHVVIQLLETTGNGDS